MIIVERIQFLVIQRTSKIKVRKRISLAKIHIQNIPVFTDLHLALTLKRVQLCLQFPICLEAWKEENLPFSPYTFSCTEQWKHAGETVVQLHSFLTSAVYDDDCSVSRPDRFTPRKGSRCPLSVGLLGSQSPSGRTEEEKNLLVLPGFRLHYPGSIIVIITTSIYLLCEWCLPLYTWNTPWYLCNIIPILHLQFMVHVMLFPMLNALHFTSALSAVCVQCPTCFFFAVP